MTINRLLISGSVIAALLAATPALAQGQRTADEINRLINELDRRPAQTDAYRSNVRSRTIKVRPDIGRQDIYRTNAAIKEIPVTLNYNHSEDFTINFRFDSFKLTRDALYTLDILGEALNRDELKDEIFLVGGHTDTVGKDDYNQWLSERRAYEVVHYLIEQWGIHPDRLQPVGFGETELLDPQYGSNKKNRRVEFTIIEPADGGRQYSYGSETNTGAGDTAAAPAQPQVPAVQPVPARQPVEQAAAPQGNVVCDTRAVQIQDPRRNAPGLDDFGNARTPAECLDNSAQTGLAPAQSRQDEANTASGGTGSVLDQTNAAFGSE